MAVMLLAEVVATSSHVASTRSRKEKVAALAALLERCDVASRVILTAYLAGGLRQRRTGVGWRTVHGLLPQPAAAASLTLIEVDAAFEHLAGLSGPGSQAARAEALTALFAAATEAEQAWLRGAITGEVRQGASDSLVVEAIARAADVPVAAVRRAVMMAGSSTTIVGAAFEGEAALARIGLEVGRPVMPMLASSAPEVAAAWEWGERPAAVDAKLDGIRIQVHRRGDDVLVVTRSLDDVTARLPDVAAAVRALPVSSVVLDGEALVIGDDGRPRAFQDTASSSAQHEGGWALSPFFFDVLHLDGVDLIDAPGRERWAALERVVPPELRVRRLLTSNLADAEAFTAQTLAAGHEGVVVKDPDAGYTAGRRGAAWVKVKPVHTLDLVVLAVEWGSGRRRGLLSNIHLGARGPDGPVMVGKTFKGMTDEMLAWQTERFLALETHREGHVVYLRPEQVVEIAVDGVQRSRRYPGGVALRFARVVRYRDDKPADEADTADAVRALL